MLQTAVFLKIIVILALVFLLLFALYRFGVISLDVRRSSLFIGSLNGNRARFRLCTGYTRRRLRFRDACTVSFTLDAALTAGTLTVELADAAGRPVLLLDAASPVGTLDVPAGSWYTRTIRFDGASGEYTLSQT